MRVKKDSWKKIGMDLAYQGRCNRENPFWLAPAGVRRFLLDEGSASELVRRARELAKQERALQKLRPAH